MIKECKKRENNRLMDKRKKTPYLLKEYYGKFFK